MFVLFFLFSSVVVSAGFTKTFIYSKPEVLEPLGDSSGTTTLLPNGEPIFQGTGWSVVGTGSHSSACSTNDSDTTYSKFVYSFGYSNLVLYYDDFLDGVNPPPSVDDGGLTITEARIYGRVGYSASGFPTSAKFNNLIPDWGLTPRDKSISPGYTNYLFMTYTNVLGNPITVNDVNDVVSNSHFSEFDAVSYGKLTYSYIEVDWDYVEPVVNPINTTGVYILGGVVIEGSTVIK